MIKLIEISMKKAQSKKGHSVFNIGTGRSVNIDFLYKLIKKIIPNRSKVIRKKLDKFDPKNRPGTFKKLKKILILKNLNLQKLEDGILKSINS